MRQLFLILFLLPIFLIPARAQQVSEPQGSPLRMTLKRMTVSGKSVVISGFLQNTSDRDVSLSFARKLGDQSILLMDDEGNMYNTFEQIRFRFGEATQKPDYENDSFGSLLCPSGVQVRFSIYVNGVNSYASAFSKVLLPCNINSQGRSSVVLFSFDSLPIPR